MNQSADRSEMYDVVIAGGGLVGATLAAALSPTGLRVGVVEAHAFRSASQPSYDDRATALARGSRTILETIGLWPGMQSAAEPIRQVHVSERGRFGITRMNAIDADVDALGYVVPNRVMGDALAAHLPGCEGVDLICPAKVTGAQPGEHSVRLALDEDGAARNIETRLLVVADGARSPLREQLGLAARIWDYDQSAVIANVTPERPHGGVAYERFTGDGPVAMLPMTDDRCAIVMTVARDRVDGITDGDEADFCRLLEARFGGRLGRIEKAGRRQAYPLYFVRSAKQVMPRVVIAGNAAHSLHPIAGQGFNLSLRDVAMLADVLADAAAEGADPGEEKRLRGYISRRRRDQIGTMAFTDALTRVFTSPLPGLGPLRGLGLAGLGLLPPARRFLMRRTMGVAGHQPRLARGIRLGET